MKRYGSNWENDGVTLPGLGIIIAPEIFVVRRNAVLRTGILILKGTKYFTWDTARELIWNNCAPKGWRMPTAEETDAICKYANDKDNVFPNYGLHGFIRADNMAEYYRSPTTKESLAISSDKVGYYWTSSLKERTFISVCDLLLRHINGGQCVDTFQLWTVHVLSERCKIAQVSILGQYRDTGLFYRPHQALNYQTPAEYCATIGITILQVKKCTRCSELV